MGEQLYSAEEAAQILGLQVRTVRNYVREGRLPGVRIGKQYRIARADLEAFTGPRTVQIPASSEAARRQTSGSPQTALDARDTPVQISSVVQVDGVDMESSERVVRTLAAVTAGRTGADPILHVEPLYDEERMRLKVVIVGSVRDSLELIRIVDTVARERGPS